MGSEKEEKQARTEWGWWRRALGYFVGKRGEGVEVEEMWGSRALGYCEERGRKRVKAERGKEKCKVSKPEKGRKL